MGGHQRGSQHGGRQYGPNRCRGQSDPQAGQRRGLRPCLRPQPRHGRGPGRLVQVPPLRPGHRPRAGKFPMAAPICTRQRPSISAVLRGDSGRLVVLRRLFRTEGRHHATCRRARSAHATNPCRSRFEFGFRVRTKDDPTVGDPRGPRPSHRRRPHRGSTMDRAAVVLTCNAWFLLSRTRSCPLAPQTSTRGPRRGTRTSVQPNSDSDRPSRRRPGIRPRIRSGILSGDTPNLARGRAAGEELDLVGGAGGGRRGRSPGPVQQRQHAVCGVGELVVGGQPGRSGQDGVPA